LTFAWYRAHHTVVVLLFFFILKGLRDHLGLGHGGTTFWTTEDRGQLEIRTYS
jgi:hypothetical protein